ncbi:MAG: hypothetical protein ABFC89_05400 [Methanospirillum sp.]
MTLLLNNALARKYGLDPCSEGGARRVRKLRRLEQTTAALEQEIAALSIELRDDRLGKELRAVLEQEYEESVAARDKRARIETEAASRVGCIRTALDAIIGDAPTDPYRRMLPENDVHGDRADAFDELVALVARRCKAAVDPSEVVGEIRRRAALADAGEGP